LRLASACLLRQCFLHQQLGFAYRQPAIDHQPCYLDLVMAD
jgi:hypothetical protein